jgi:hypothetical protein
MESIFAVGGVGQRQNGVGVSVVDVVVRDEAVKQGLDGGTRGPWLHETVGQISDHLVVRHQPTFTEGIQILEPDAGEILPLGDLQIGSRSLDAHHAHGAATKIRLGLLDRGIAASPDDQTRLDTDEPRSVDEQVHANEVSHFLVTP